ncbi:DNA mismatch endonuclease Vsr [Agrobacterium sp. Ap1]|uniref:very short patch repair endonuclease n=1 Tax=Agrobacterium sp. Ap1 TaxID=2815337 RepID=UPI001A8D8CF9|nr:DNA mismatch endonuclease Vsr [Agrobacterium sp. Ap1]MBO0145426.1 DNA mismatch endonuclease Vsr [Agrobacterium sp. Ap1]
METSVQRSKLMAKVKAKDTSPEMVVRRAAHALGFRYRLHQKSLAGSPDLVFPGKRKVIFVHGCFWHRHTDCRYSTVPKSNVHFWQAKFDRNVERDQSAIQRLCSDGWEVLVIWQCETRDPVWLRDQLIRFLGAR